MIIKEANNGHRKHAKLPQALTGEWGRVELALLGAPCGTIASFALAVSVQLSDQWKIGYADADHGAGEAPQVAGLAAHFTDKISYSRIDIKSPSSALKRHALFNDCDAVLLNGNHFHASRQIVFIDPGKSLESKTDRLTDVRLVLLKDADAIIPAYLKPYLANAPVLVLDEMAAIVAFFKDYLRQQVAPINGLVLSGGRSERMGMDKSLLSYHGSPQREHLYDLLQPICREVFISCNAVQRDSIAAPKIEDRFLGIGPMGGLLSAFQSAPDRAWLVAACDLPYLSRKTLDYLIAHRNPSKMATAFMDSDSNFPEPLITIWEPRSYAVLLQALSEGITCPRKVLINADIEMLHAPDTTELHNVNDPASFNEAQAHLKLPSPKLPSR